MLTSALNPPEIIGQLDPSVIAHLQNEFPDQRIDTEWYRQPTAQQREHNQRLLDVLRPLQEIVIRNEVRCCYGVPWGVYYAVDTRDVSAGGTQRQHQWHIDGDGRGRSLVVADTLPTEFLVKDSDSSRRTNLRSMAARLQLLKQTRDRVFGDLTDEEITRSNLTVYQPEAYELAYMRDHIHRSPTNLGEATVARTWIRAAIIYRKHQ